MLGGALILSKVFCSSQVLLSAVTPPGKAGEWGSVLHFIQFFTECFHGGFDTLQLLDFVLADLAVILHGRQFAGLPKGFCHGLHIQYLGVYVMVHILSSGW